MSEDLSQVPTEVLVSELLARNSQHACTWCGKGVASRLCDAILSPLWSPQVVTCDAPMCESCASSSEFRFAGHPERDANMDYCPRHITPKMRSMARAESLYGAPK